MKKFLAFFFVLAVFVSAWADSEVKTTIPQRNALSSPDGRYVFGQISAYRRDQYMLDTQTGRLWHIVSQSSKNADGTARADDGLPVLSIIPYLGAEGKMTLTPK